MRLIELIKGAGYTIPEGVDAEVSGVTADSRKVSQGTVFVAVKGCKSDGAGFALEAVKNGAVAIVSEKEMQIPGVPVITVFDAREAVGRLSSIFFNKPSEKLTMAGVTGTNGKTTVAYLIESIFRAGQHRPGLIGTVGYRHGAKNIPAPYTTPEAEDLQRLLNDMLSSGVTHCVMEVSSHSIEQKRISGCRYDARVFTNLTPEHLDYHGTMEGYFAAKRKFFSRGYAKPGAASVVNIDDKWGAMLRNGTENVLGYSVKEKTDIYPKEYSIALSGIKAVLATPKGDVYVNSPFIGEHNLQNIMAAAGAAAALDIPVEAIENGINSLKAVPGRLESVSSGSGITAYVDYAHTPDALDRVLTVFNRLSRGGRIITVFGCGGNRDKSKRPVMGEIAARLSHLTIVTSDNPRNEDPLEIIKEIESGIRGVKKYIDHERVVEKGYMAVPDRGEAILKAVEAAGKGDTILVAGKGHEDYQIIGDKRLHFDDREALRNILKVVGPLK
ncbi:MAG: UDP-N-acetylmuramoyl-L-alanyl-D-glutamate--2,6-diaminopimelate ligase [Thermodesulfobacteriota bacterium]